MVRRRRRRTANSKSTSSVRPVRDIPAAFQTTTYGWTKRILRPTQDRRIYRWISDGMEVERCHVAYLCCTFWTLSQRAIFRYLTKQYPRFNSHWMNNRQLYYHVQGKRILGPNTYKAISLLTVNSYERSLNYNKHLIAQRSSKIMWFMVRIKSKL